MLESDGCPIALAGNDSFRILDTHCAEFSACQSTGRAVLLSMVTELKHLNLAAGGARF